MIGYFVWGERVPVSGGVGWDGVIYWWYATHFWTQLTTTTDSYHVNRILPSFIIRCATKALHININQPQNTAIAFMIFNDIIITLSAWLWYKICQLKSFNTLVYLIGFISLFVSWAVLKFYQYDPALTDPCAFFLGILALYFYLKRSSNSSEKIWGVLLFITLILAYYTWPISLVIVAPLFLYPLKQTDNSSFFRKNSRIFSMIAILVYLGYVYWLYQTPGYPISMTLALVCSVLVVCTYVYFATSNSIALIQWRSFFRINYNLTAVYIFLFLFCYITHYILVHLSIHYGKQPAIFSFSSFINERIFVESIRKPAVSLIASVAFWGPISILLLAYFKKILTKASEENFGALLFILLSFFFILDPESRQSTFEIPFLIYFLCAALNEKRLTIRFVVFYFISALICSKIYYAIGVGPTIATNPFSSLARYFMNFGPWMTWPQYYFNLTLTVISVILIYIGLNNRHLGIK